MSQDFVGFVTKIESYTRVKSSVYGNPQRILKYGAYVLVRDRSEGTERRYLAIVEDVAEENISPLIDYEVLKQMFKEQYQSGELRDFLQLIKLLYTPGGQAVIQWYGVRELSLRVLGEIRGRGKEASLVEIERPPRAMSLVEEMEPEELEAIIRRGQSDENVVRVGKLLYNETTPVYLDINKFNMHVAVVGQTGSGKTETVKRILAEYAMKGVGGVVVLDVAGEYSGITYEAENTSPLLGAVLKPENYGLSGNPPEKVTIIIPYSLNYVRMDKEYVKEIEKVVIEKLKGAYGVDFDLVHFGGFRKAWTVDTSGRPRALSDEEVEYKLNNSRYLVIALPLPDSMRAEMVYELSKSKSDYFVDILEEMASRLGMIHGDLIENITFIAAVAEAENDGKMEELIKLMKDTFFNCSSDRTLDIDCVNTVLEKYPGIKDHLRLKNLLGRSLVRFLVSMEERLREEGTDANKREKVWEGVEKRVRQAVGVLRAYESKTKRSFARGLSRVASMISPVLTPKMYSDVVRRATSGFTIVHTAPPSVGDTDTGVARMIEEIFVQAIETFEDRMKGKKKILLALEEAHNFVPAKESTWSKRVVRKIAREGRKWGLSLFLITQRPGFVDSHVLSQCGTLVAMRITNPEDLANIKKSVESVTQDMVDRLPDLEPGTALISGVALPERRIPVITRVDMLKKEKDEVSSVP